METYEYHAAYSAAIEALAKKQPLAPLCGAALSAHPSKAGDLMSGIIKAMCQALDAVQASYRAQGLSVTVADQIAQQLVSAEPQARRFYFSALLTGKSAQEIADVLGHVVGVIENPMNRISITMESAPKAEAPPQRIELVNIGDMPVPAALAITAMPDRVTTTEIERDATGSIVQSTQIESDR